MHTKDYTQKQRDQISSLQQAIWALENAAHLITISKCSTSVLQAVDAALEKANAELNDISTLM